MANPNPDTSGLREPWKPGESGNPNGRPRKMVSEVLNELEDVGIEQVTKQQVIGAIEVLLNCQEDDLEQYAKDENHSMLIRIVAKHIMSADENDKLFDMLLNRAFGKPDQKTDITTDGEQITAIQFQPINESED